MDSCGLNQLIKFFVYILALNVRQAFLRAFYVLSSNRALQMSSVLRIVEKIGVVAVATYARTELCKPVIC